MLRGWIVGVAVLVSLSGSVLNAQESALEKDPKGWKDLFPGKDLKGWKRVALAPDVKLSEKNPWSVAADGKTLLCDGVGIKEMFLFDEEFGDGIFHVEWRFRPSDKKDYNSGVYVRSKADGKLWLQVQVAHLEKPPFLGDIFGDLPTGDKLERVIIRGDGVKRGKTPGEWNTYEVTAKGKTVSVWINGATTLTWNDCPFPRGHVGMQAEFFFIEFRNIKFKALK